MRKQKSRSADEQIAMQVSVNSILVNLVLSACKMAAGIFAGSGALISDAVHTATDVFSTFIVMIGIRMSGKEADDKHPYGHERMECVASVILSVVLGFTGLGIGLEGVRRMTGGASGQLGTPGALALIAALTSILVKELMYWYTRAAARRIHSSALMADAWHHRSDALSSVGSFAGVLGARMGFPALDPLAGVVISALIVKASFDIFMDAMEKMVDEACDGAVVANMRHAIMRQEGVWGIDGILTRRFGSRIYVDIEISADGDLPLREAHRVAERVHDVVEADFPAVKHCMVHVNPNLKPAVHAAAAGQKDLAVRKL